MNLDKKAKILRKMYSWQMSLITLLHSPVNCNLKTSQKKATLELPIWSKIHIVEK